MPDLTRCEPSLRVSASLAVALLVAPWSGATAATCLLPAGRRPDQPAVRRPAVPVVRRASGCDLRRRTGHPGTRPSPLES